MEIQNHAKLIGRFIFDSVIFLGAFACILVWLGLKTQDLWGWHVRTPHWGWVASAIILFLIGIASSSYGLYRSLKTPPEIARVKEETANQIVQLNKQHEFEEIRAREARDEARVEVERLKKELSHWQAKHDRDLTNALNDKAVAENNLRELSKPRTYLLEGEALRTLPVYPPSSMRIDTYAICEGLKIDNNYIFCHVRLTSSVTTGILNAWIHVRTTTGNRYKGEMIENYSDWIVVEPFSDMRYHMSNSRDIALESVALPMHRLTAGLPEKGWIGFAVITDGTDANLFPNVKVITIEFEDGNGGKHKLELPDRESWPETKYKVVHTELRSPR